MKRERAYSLLTIKAVDDEKRVIEGVASTPVTDRAGDIVEPLGAKYELPIPFLWQHRSDSPIGHVVAAKVTDEGITIRAQLAQIDEPGELKNLLDKAWQAIKLGLVRGLSIGFKPLESADIAGSWGQRVLSWEWLELSAVTIAANQEATIQTVKSLDAALLAEVGRSAVPARSRGSVKLIQPKAQGGTVFDIQKQIQGYEATRQAKAAELVAIMEKSAQTGETLDAEQTERYDEIQGEIKTIDAHLARLGELERLNFKAAKPVVDLTPKAPGQQDPPAPARIVVKGPVELEKGVRFARVVKAMGQAHMKHRDVALVARELYPDDALVQKAAVAAGNTISGWASGLVGDETGVFADFVEFLRPQTILGKFGTNGIPDLRRVPFRTPLVTQTAGGAGYWVGEGKPKPLTSFNFTRTTLEPLKVANIAVLTEEVLMSSSPAADNIIREALVAALKERLDIDFIDPDKVAVANTSPASITNGIVTIAAAGTGTAEDIRTDIKAMMGAFLDADNPPQSGVWIMSSKNALAAALLRTALDQAEFPSISMNGGTLFGMPVITSEHVPTANYGPIVVLLNASDIYLGDEGGFQVDVSREASLQMDDAPGTQNALTGTGTSLVSLWQTNSVGFRAERIINWARRRATSVAVLKDVAWG